MLGDRGREDAQFGPFGLQPLLHPVENSRGITRGGSDNEVVVGETDDRAIVFHHAVGRAHHAVTDRANLQRTHQVRVEHVEEGAGIRTLQVDFAEGGPVEASDRGTGGGALAGDRCVEVFPRQRVIPGPFPLADVFEQRAVRDVPVVDGGDPNRVEQFAAVGTGQYGEGDRGERRTEHRRAQRGDRDVETRGHHTGADNPGGFALIESGAEGRIALDMLHRAETRAGGTQQLSDGDIALHVDETHIGFGKFGRGGDGPDLLDRVEREVAHEGGEFDGAVGFGALDAGWLLGSGRLDPDVPSVGQFGQRRPGGVRSPGKRRGEIRLGCGEPGEVNTRNRFGGDKGGQRLVKTQPPGGLTEQVQHRIPAARHEQQIAVQWGCP